jgi:selenocysteine lyase/cysteine desulfurase
MSISAACATSRAIRSAAPGSTRGSGTPPSVFGHSAAINFQNAIGKKTIEARVHQLGDRLRRELQQIPGVRLYTPMDASLSAGRTTVGVRDIPMENVQKAIFEHSRVFIRTMPTGDLNAVRASTHFYNFPYEVDRLVASVRYVSGNASKFMTWRDSTVGRSARTGGVVNIQPNVQRMLLIRHGSRL